MNRRLSKISSSAEIFNDAAPPYQDALNKSGYEYKLKFSPPDNNHSRKRNRSRNVTWFNPPHSENVATNIGKRFFSLLDRSFPPGHQLHKLLNRNTIKLSYSCMPNIKRTISKHNASVLSKSELKPTDDINTCNCRDKLQCPLQNKCLTSSVIYQATVTRNDNMAKDT